MKSAARLLRPLAIALFVAQAGFAQAQEVPESHLAAAKAAVTAVRATDQFDGILSQAADALKSQLIQKNPDLLDLISNTVDETVLSLAARRADLEKEAATLYAKAFTEQELKDIAAFYTSESGKKLLNDGPIVSRELINSAEIWQKGIARDLAEKVAAALKAKAPQAAPADAPADGQAAPADGQAPAEGEPKPQQ